MPTPIAATISTKIGSRCEPRNRCLTEIVAALIGTQYEDVRHDVSSISGSHQAAARGAGCPSA
jgi:hypothetical protein